MLMTFRCAIQSCVIYVIWNAVIGNPLMIYALEAHLTDVCNLAVRKNRNGGGGV